MKQQNSHANTSETIGKSNNSDFAIKEYDSIIKKQRIKDHTIIIMGAMMALMVISFGVGLVSIVKYFDKSRIAIIDGKGSVGEITRISKDEFMILECKNHILTFVDYFYRFDATNIENQINKALWISDNSVKALFDNYKVKNWYQKITQFNIFQTCQIIDDEIKVDITKQPYEASFSAIISLREGFKTEKFKFSATCKLVGTNRSFGKNPHGLIVTDYKQTELEHINNNN
jgi:hypothetical protein